MDTFNEIYTKQFATSEKAVNFCQSLARYCGFGIRIRTSKISTIYLVCSREGKPEAKKTTKVTKKRNRNSDRCNCDWRIVLYESDGLWQFKAGKRVQHNHPTAVDEIFKNQFKTAKISNNITPNDFVRLPSIESLLMGSTSYQTNFRAERPTASVSPLSNDSYYCNSNASSISSSSSNSLPKILNYDTNHSLPTNFYSPYTSQSSRFHGNNYGYSYNNQPHS